MIDTVGLSASKSIFKLLDVKLLLPAASVDLSAGTASEILTSPEAETVT